MTRIITISLLAALILSACEKENQAARKYPDLYTQHTWHVIHIGNTGYGTVNPDQEFIETFSFGYMNDTAIQWPAVANTEAALLLRRAYDPDDTSILFSNLLTDDSSLSIKIGYNSSTKVMRLAGSKKTTFASSSGWQVFYDIFYGYTE
ncbi:MAG: hypothetical protein EOP51_01920 [Sphingobacteriales bacterium]|nr:MAG: hypothetical protein EOP51_01920 [Sphingobacteriales bacterium]